MTLKSLVNSLTAGAAATVLAGAAAVGVTSIAVGSGIASASPAAIDAPMPAAPAPELQGPLMSTLSALAGPGSFSGAKSSYVQGGLGRIEARVADSGYSNAAAKGSAGSLSTLGSSGSCAKQRTASSTALLIAGCATCPFIQIIASSVRLNFGKGGRAVVARK